MCKMRRDKRIIFIMIACFFLLGCGTRVGTEVQEEKTGKEGSDASIDIGVTMASDDSSYIIELVKNIEIASAGENINLEIQYAQWDAEIQVAQIAEYVAEGKDAIILCPVDAKSMLVPLKSAEEKGVPIINLNMKVDAVSTQYISTYVGASSSEEGALAAELAMELLNGENGKIGIIEGSPGSDPSIYRTEAFLEEMKSVQNAEVVGITCGSWSREKAYLAAWDLINNNQEMNMIYAHDSNMALGAYQAIQELGKENDIQLVAIGENEEYLEALEAGIIDGIITQPAEYEGKYSVYCAINAVNGVQLKPWYKTPVTKITNEDIENYKYIQY